MEKKNQWTAAGSFRFKNGFSTFNQFSFNPNDAMEHVSDVQKNSLIAIIRRSVFELDFDSCASYWIFVLESIENRQLRMQ